ncbi:formimidoylglutamase [Paraglaciecola aestuariivivens]
MAKIDNSYHWVGRTDSEDGQKGLRFHQVVGQQNHQQSCALVGFQCDLGVAANKGRVGSALGPNAIRSSLANLAWHAPCNLFDAGNIKAAHQLADAQDLYAQSIQQSLTKNQFVIGLGGGHEIAWGSYQGLFQHLAKHPNKSIGIINFDAHFDLRKPAPSASSGTPFRQIAEYCQEYDLDFNYVCLGVSEAANTPALFDYAKQTRTEYLLDTDCTFQAAKHLLEPFLFNIDELYVTVCLDAFPAYQAPGVSAPSALGISVQMVIDTLHWIAQSQASFGFNWSLADIAEMNPNFDQDNRTAKLAARLVFEMLKAKFVKGQ